MTAIQVSANEYLDLKKVEILVDSITEFGIIRQPLYYKHGGFKKFNKRGYVVSNGIRYLCGDYHIPDLKLKFKGRTSLSKTPVKVFKYDGNGNPHGERRAINWTYKIDNQKLLINGQV